MSRLLKSAAEFWLVTRFTFPIHTRHEHQVPGTPTRHEHQVPGTPTRHEHQVPGTPTRHEHQVPGTPTWDKQAASNVKNR